MDHLTKPRLFLLLLCICIPLNWVSAQASGLPDTPSQAKLEKHRGDPGFDRRVSWRSLPKDFLHDQKDIWLFPVSLAHGRHWTPTIAISGITGGLIVADPHAMPYFQSHARNLDDINDVFDPLITSAEVIAVPASLMLAGYADRKSVV